MRQPSPGFHLRSMTEMKLGQLLVMLKTKQAAVHQLLRRREGIAVERSADPSDEAQSALDRELSIRALDRESSLLSDIRFALRRIDDGTYGVCQSCDEEISEKRLTAMPWAKYCIQCQEEMDRTPDRDVELLAAS
jgi:RNA polymerase-binding transcription factor